MAEEPGSSEELARAAVAGDNQSFARLYERLAPALYSWARLRIPASLRPSFEPDDLVQEVWWRALDALSTHDPAKGRFRGWLFTIANRVLLNGFRRARVSSARVPKADHGMSSMEAEITAISRRVVRDEMVDQLLSEVGRLEPLDQAIFVHCGLEGLTAGQTAVLLGKGNDAVLKRWQRIREKLQRFLTREGLVEA